jgi:urease accessory protein
MPAAKQDPLEAVLINTAGGLTGGDRIAWQIEAGAGTSVSVTTQACEKVYRALSGEARAAVRLSADTGARIAWLPQETIIYDRSAFARRLDVDLAQGAEVLLAEASVFGRLAMGERVRHAMFRDRWRVWMDGRLIHAEDFRIGPDIEATLGRPAVAVGAAAFATVLMVSPNAGMLLSQARHIIGEAGGASAWTVGASGKLLARIVAGNGYLLRQRLVPLLGMLNGQAALPKIWSI